MLQYPNMPHARDIDALKEELRTSAEGLTAEEVNARLEIFGKNTLPEGGRQTWWQMLFKQFRHLMVYILLIAALISYFTGHHVDVYVILAIVLINAIIGFVQEYNAENAVAALKGMLLPQCKVIRNGALITVDAESLVPGDILSIEEGDAIAADGRILTSSNLRCMEASLTGESVPVGKSLQVFPESTPMADRHNMVWKGTFVAGGSAKILVTGTGLQTALGGIAKSLTQIKGEKTNFQQKTEKLARQMAMIAIASALILFIVGFFFRGMEWSEILLVSIAALVSAIPEGLPAVLSIVLAIGAYRMSKRKAIIREFSATESLGAVSVILTDKTGTLTQNTMTIQKIALPLGQEHQVSGEGWSSDGSIMDYHTGLDPMLEVATYCHHAAVKSEVDEKGNLVYKVSGDPTEAAFVVLARKAEKQKLINIQSDLPFSSDFKFRGCVLDRSADNLLILGAPDQLVEMASHYWNGNEKILISSQDKAAMLAQIALWSEEALRVIGLASRDWKKEGVPAYEEVQEICLLGFAGMMDPPRQEVPVAVSSCRNAGIRVIMATGDHAKTALAIARKVGIVTEHDAQEAYSQTDLEKMSKEEFEEVVQRANVFARLTPQMKMQIADVLQKRGELVAMTGDGVNDAPALKKADVGVAMGIMGTDVARDAARMVLADDNFATIVNAVEEGRIVFNNARRTSFFLVTTNFAEIFTLIAAIAAGLPMPLTATQILWINLVTDGLCDKALATEKGHGDELEKKPLKTTDKILNKEVIPFIVLNALVMTTLALWAFYSYLPDSTEKARTMVFIIIAFSQLFNVFNMRDLENSVFRFGMFSNKWVNWALIGSVIIQVLIIEIPVLAGLFSFEVVHVYDFLKMVALSSLVLWFGEAYKWFRKKAFKG